MRQGLNFQINKEFSLSFLIKVWTLFNGQEGKFLLSN